MADSEFEQLGLHLQQHSKEEDGGKNIKDDDNYR